MLGTVTVEIQLAPASMLMLGAAQAAAADQCDQMARLFFQYLTNYTKEKFLNSKRGSPK